MLNIITRNGRRNAVYILLALGALASIGLSGYNPFNQMTAKGMLMPQLPVRAEQSHFDTISKRAYAASIVQHEVEITSGDRNVTIELAASNNNRNTSLEKGSTKKFVINIGMPKTGTTSLTDFLKQNGYECAHWRADGTIVGIEVRKNLFSNALKDFNCITQLDYCHWVSKAENISRCIWPQHEMLTELVSRFPDAKYVYTTRNTTAWFDSVSRWSDLLDRIRFSNTPGLQYGATDDEVKKWYEAKQKAAQLFFQQTHQDNRLFILPVEKSQSLAPELFVFLGINNTSVTLKYPESNTNS